MRKSNSLRIRVDGNPKIGTGHIMRCLALADAFRERGTDSVFILAEPHMRSPIQERGYACSVLGSAYDRMEEELPKLLPLLEDQCPAGVILDSYFVTPDYMREVRRAAPLVYIDDLDLFDYPADVVVNYNLYGARTKYPSSELRLLGPRYAPLRRQFQGLAPRVVRRAAKDLLISTGGTDQYHAALRCAEYLREHPPGPDVTYHFVLGAMNPDVERIQELSAKMPYIVPHRHVTDMRALMLRCDAAVSAAGTTLYELCACGLPTVTYILADNQIKGAAAFEAAGLMPCAGDVREDRRFPERIFSELERLAASQSGREDLSRQMQRLVDGAGAGRLAEELTAYLDQRSSRAHRRE